MATPLYKKMKDKGTSFYSFNSSSMHMNLGSPNDSYKVKFNKFVLLNIPQQVTVTGDQTKGVLNFDKDTAGPLFYNFQPGGTISSVFGEQLIESLRNYVANYDATMHESRINANTDFYNINETVTPTEMVFWKWCRKLNLIDLEPALHKIDWDKNIPDFDNNNGSGNNFFQKYLWKERDVNYYTATLSQGGSNKATITIGQNAKYKVGDYVNMNGDTGAQISSGTSYMVSAVVFGTNQTTLTLNATTTDSTQYDVTVYLDYHKLIQYIGEIQADSNVQTSRSNYREITAQIPHQAGQTPTVLFDINDNTNYYPGLELPILPTEQQEEIVGAENINSPIRMNPSDYAGTYYGYFDTADKTYKCTNGDKIRKSGPYYGVLLNNNIGTNSEKYFEKLTDFNSDNIDGLKLDFDTDHYYKMNLSQYNIRNFDEFNSTNFDGAPRDFDFNTILWYYTIDDGSGDVKSNLYGVEFLNNPSNDDDTCDYNNKLITPYKKLVSNGNQDGLSYIFNININTNIDNDVLPLSYDPTTIYNQFGFDLYQNILQTTAKVNDNFMTIISGFTYLNEEVFNIKSMVYSQTDIDRINSELANLNELLKLYSTFQFVDSDTAQVQTTYEGSYPTLKFNVINKKYDDITNINMTDVFKYNQINSGSAYNINVPTTNQLLINIYNNNNDFDGTASILLNRDLAYKQAMEIYITPKMSKILGKLNININFNNGSTTTQQTLIGGINLPTDVSVYNTLTPSASTMSNSFYTNNSLRMVANNTSSYTSTSNTTKLSLNDNVLVAGDYVYIDNLYYSDKKDHSGVYLVNSTGVTYNKQTNYTGVTYDINITLNTNGLTLISNPVVSYYKGIKINILRVSSLTNSTITDRYQIRRELL